MATVFLSAAGAALGGAIGGQVLGLKSAVIGRAVGSTLGRVIDQRILGEGTQAVETGRVDRFRLTGAGEGGAVPQVYGRMRVGGQVIWASDFTEIANTQTTGGGKGRPQQPKTTTTSYSYTVNLALALCEGEIARVGRVWADGQEIARTDLNMEVHHGTADQAPDGVMEAIEGSGNVPAYRGTAYVVFSDLDLAPFGNRVPQFSFEVIRPEQSDADAQEINLHQRIEGVALIPGTGEYSLATTPVYYSSGPASRWAANLNSPSGVTDFSASMDALRDELPNCTAASLILCWFGTDLRCGDCRLRPMVERSAYDGENMPWSVSGVSRAEAEEIARVNDSPIYGGTPTDRSVIEAIKEMTAAGQAVMFYPFILMDQQEGNALPDPYSDAQTQPKLPWRGRITLSKAPGVDGSPDGTAQADAEVAAFFGSAEASDFTVSDGEVHYDGAPDDWGLRRFILHYAALCAAAGGVSAFCISSEMRGLTQIRGAGNRFVAVEHLRQLARDVRRLLGPEVKIGYAADWSEYFGYQPQDGSNDRYFHLDPLWADEAIDFVGIDNYMPLSDWREGEDHLDARSWPAIYDLEYLKSNIEGGEGYDWFYDSEDARATQRRTPIEDTEFNEPWIWRYKDLRNWWSNAHYERIGGMRQTEPTAWVPQSKPFWFTEYGCAAVDKGTNQPNKFVDPKSSESSLPRFSNGARDDLIQMQYLRAMIDYWDDPAHNPVSELYAAPMLDLSRFFVWSWDTRPFPTFPNNRALWDDGANYARGHWISGRLPARSLASVVGEMCRRAGVTEYDTSGLYGLVRGYVVDQVSDARAALQPLMLRYGFDAIERDGVLRFVMRQGTRAVPLDRALLAQNPEQDGDIEQVRAAQAEMAGRVRLQFVQADADFDMLAEEAILGDDATHAVAGSELPLALTRAEGRQTAERWLAESRIARETVRFSLPLSMRHLGAGDVVSLPPDEGERAALYRIDRVEQTDLQIIEAVRIEPETYTVSEIEEDQGIGRSYLAPVPVLPLFLDVPLITGDEVPHAPYVAATAQPWPGRVAVYASPTDDNYRVNQLIDARATIGVTETPLAAAQPGLWDRGQPLQVRLLSGALESKARAAVLSGGNLAAIGDGSPENWELFQFETAELDETGAYLIGTRLRGQLGTDALMPAVWPVGSYFVLFDGTPQQLDFATNQRLVEQHYRIGPANRAYDDASYQARKVAFAGNGLRPYAPVHLRHDRAPEGDDLFQWIRRTRIEGDPWDGLDVPLGEESERYLVRVLSQGDVIQETTVASPNWRYLAQDRADAGLDGGYRVAVAQVSARFGPGPFRELTVLT